MLVYEEDSEMQPGLEVTNPISAPLPTHGGANSDPLTTSTSGAASSTTAGPCLDGRMGKPPPELLRATLEDNEEFQQLTELLVVSYSCSLNVEKHPRIIVIGPQCLHSLYYGGPVKFRRTMATCRSNERVSRTMHIRKLSG